MKRIPFTIEDWKAGGVPVTRSGVYIKQLTWFEGATNSEYPLHGLIGGRLDSWSIIGKSWVTLSEYDTDLFLEVPCTKYFTHYYKNIIGTGIYSYTTQEKDPSAVVNANYIKTVEVEL